MQSNTYYSIEKNDTISKEMSYTLIAITSQKIF